MRRFLDALDWGGPEPLFTGGPGATAAVRLVLRSAAAELYALPWELVTLKDSGLHLAELPGFTVLYEWPKERKSLQPTATPQGGRVLFAWSAAGGLVPAEEHLQALQEACRAGDLPFDPQRDVLSHVSLRSLEQQLQRVREPVSVLHLLCHGTPLQSQGTPLYGLAWSEGGVGGDMQIVDGGALAAVLAPYSSTLRMVVLCACHGGDSGALASYLGSVAQALHRAGIETVLASRLPLSSQGSVLLTQTLYRKLLVDSCSLEEALGAVRRTLRIASSGFDWGSLQLYAHRQDKADLRPVLLRPYRGLLAFEPRHRRFFFGRQKLEAALLERVLQAADGRRPRFQVVAGASGTGKSSVVMAGLVPLLPAEQWDWWVVRPGELVRADARGTAERSAALEELRGRLFQRGPSQPLPSRQSSTLDELLEEMRQFRQAHPRRKLLIVVDQLEEVFTQLEGQERQALMRGLWALTCTPELHCVVVATLRVDHFERCGEVALDDATRLDSVVYSSEHRLFVAQMEPREVAEAIEQPALKVGLELEPGLVDRLRKDVGQEPGALPLLEHALDLLWQKREGRWLKHQTYEDMGGIAGALTQTADHIYEELSVSERHQARRLLVRLVAVRDMGSPRARGRVWVEEVRPPEGADREAFEAALEKLVSRRLLVKGGSGDGDPGGRGAWVQLAHETLLRRWKRLERWVDEDWEREQQVRELEKWAEDWLAHLSSPDGGASYLLAGDRLGYAKSLREKLEGELSEQCRRLIAESQALEERQREQEWARQHKERQMLQALSEAWIRARSTARILRAEQVRTWDLTKGLLVLLEVEDFETNQTWAGAAIDALQMPVAQVVLRGHKHRLTTAAFSPDEQLIVTASKDGMAKVWSLDGRLLTSLREHLVAEQAPTRWLWVGHFPDGRTRRDSRSSLPLPSLPMPGDPRIAVRAASFSPDGRQVVLASDDDTAQIWSVQGKLLATLGGHGSAVVSAAFSPDGQRVVTASWDNTAKVWSVQGQLLTTLQGHSKSVYQASFSPDGQWIVTASEDKTARVWSVRGKSQAKLKGHKERLEAAAFSPDGQKVVTASLDTTVRVWSVRGRLLATLGGHGDRVVSASFSPDGQRIVTASADRTARVWSTEGELLATLGGHGDGVVSASFSPDGQQVVTASADKTARVWSVQEKWDENRARRVHGKLLATLAGHNDSVISAKFSPSGHRVVTASADGEARVWNVGNVLSQKLEGHEDEVYRGAFSPDGQRVVTASADGTARVWSAEGALLVTLEGHGDAVRSAAFSPDAQRVVTASQDKTAKVWSVQGQLLATLEGHDDRVVSASFSPDGQRVVTASEDGRAWLWSSDGTQLDGLWNKGQRLSSAVFSPDGKWVLVTSTDGTAALWNSDGHSLVRLLGHHSSVRDGAFSPDGQRVVTASDDMTARVWSMDGTMLAVIEGTFLMHGVAFSPDSKRIMTCDGTVSVWSAEGELLAALEGGHTEHVESATFSPDGRWVATSSGDGTTGLWSAEGRLLGTLRGHSDTVNWAAFSLDGKYVVTASKDRMARVWPISATLLMERLKAATRECLEIEERQAYLDETPEQARAGYERCQLASRSRP